MHLWQNARQLGGIVSIRCAPLVASSSSIFAGVATLGSTLPVRIGSPAQIQTEERVQVNEKQEGL